MPQNEVSFLLGLLNSSYKEGRLPDDLVQRLIIYRLLALGLWAEFHPGRELWYTHVNDESGKWEN